MKDEISARILRKRRKIFKATDICFLYFLVRVNCYSRKLMFFIDLEAHRCLGILASL
jgi:hypothetical protein